VDGDSVKIEEAFAQAEPPTHDDWIPDVLEDPHHRSYIRVGMREIHRFVEEFVVRQEGGHVTVIDASLEQISADLGGLILVNDPLIGRYNGKNDRIRKSGNRRSLGKPQLQLIDQGRPYMADGKRSLLFAFDISGKIPEQGIQIQAFPRVVVIGGSNENAPPDRSVVPEVIYWKTPDGKNMGAGDTIMIGPEDVLPGHWTVAVSVPEDAMAGLGLAIQDKDDEVEVEEVV